MKRVKTYSIVCILILLNACVVYYPQTVDIPLIKEKGDMRINAGYALSPSVEQDPDTDGIEATLSVHGSLSYGLTNVVAAQAYLNFDFLGRSHIQGSVGLFKKLENDFVAELYGGYGLGTGGFQEENTKPDRYHLPFSQFNIGKSSKLSPKLHFDYALGIKVGYLFTDYKESNLSDQRNGRVFEPSVSLRLGGKKVRGSLIVNRLWLANNDPLHKTNISLGINISLNTLHKTDKKMPVLN
ncbi:MAG: hypothetical protein LBP96_03115 [Bacteroidales bacterium]|jgi:hypothetical protein|nr:hypothetical protein [Bacteroidales bacterium]